MRILVLGAGGMAGHVIAIRLRESGHTVTGLARRSLPFCDTVVADAADIDALKSTVQSGFDAIVNAVGILPRAIDANPYGGIWTNACLPHLLADWTRGTDTRIVHLSTDCVFSGQDGGGYIEESICTACDRYGCSKALGELNDDKNLTFRTSIVGPDINENGVGLFHWFMRQSGEVSGFRRAIWTGVTTITLAQMVETALRHGVTGLYHLVNNDKISKYALLGLFNELRAEPVQIVPDDSYSVDKSLLNTRTDFRFAVRSYGHMTREMGTWIAEHQALYPQYRLTIK